MTKMMKMIKVRAAKMIAPSAATSQRRCPVLAARPGTCIFFLARQMSRRPERAVPLGVPNAQNKQFMMRQREKFCKLISQRAESECGRKSALSGERDSIRKAEQLREGEKRQDLHARAEIISFGTGRKFHPKPRGILVLRVLPSCRKPSSFSPATPDFTME
jgi:hypothetical protein